MEKRYTELAKMSFLDNGIKVWKQITILIVVSFLLQGIIVYYMYTRAVEKAIDRVYIARDFSLERIEDKRAMASGHVQNFYKLFFVSPLRRSSPPQTRNPNLNEHFLLAF